MEKIIRAMMDLIASEVCGKEIDKSQYTLTDEELVKLYKLSKSHDLAHLVGDALIKNNLIEDGEIKAKFQKQIMLAVYRYEKLGLRSTFWRLRVLLHQRFFLFSSDCTCVVSFPSWWMRSAPDSGSVSAPKKDAFRQHSAR